MSWTCPHRTEDGHCDLRIKKCQPGAEGCVLEGKVRFVRAEPDPEEEEK